MLVVGAYAPAWCWLRPWLYWKAPLLGHSAANIRALQCVARLGFSLAVRVTIASRTSALIGYLPARAPLPLSLSRRSTPPST
jgi:hypothetical protein